MKPATTESLTETLPGNVVPVLEGTIKLCKNPEQKEYQGKQYEEQWGVLTLPDGGECQVTVTGKHCGSLVKGAYLRATPGVDKKGSLNGVKCKNYTSKKDGKLVLNVAVNAFANLTVDGGPSGKAPAATGGNAPKNAVGFTTRTVEDLADDWFRIFCRVARAHAKAADSTNDCAKDMLVGLGPEQLVPIATTIFLSTKTPAGVPTPFFSQAKKKEKEDNIPGLGDDEEDPFE